MVPLLVVSRVIHGYTILLFPLTVVWIGTKEALEQRSTTLAERNACARASASVGFVV